MPCPDSGPRSKKTRVTSPVSKAALSSTYLSPASHVTKCARKLNDSNQTQFFSDHDYCGYSAGQSKKSSMSEKPSTPLKDITQKSNIPGSVERKKGNKSSGKKKVDHSTPLRERLKKSFLQNDSTSSSVGANSSVASLLDDTWLSAVDHSANSSANVSSHKAGEKKKKKKKKLGDRYVHEIDGLVLDCGNSCALTMELPQSCAKLSNFNRVSLIICKRLSC